MIEAPSKRSYLKIKTHCLDPPRLACLRSSSVTTTATAHNPWVSGSVQSHVIPEGSYWDGTHTRKRIRNPLRSSHGVKCTRAQRTRKCAHSAALSRAHRRHKVTDAAQKRNTLTRWQDVRTQSPRRRPSRARSAPNDSGALTKGMPRVRDRRALLRSFCVRGQRCAAPTTPCRKGHVLVFHGLPDE